MYHVTCIGDHLNILFSNYPLPHQYILPARLTVLVTALHKLRKKSLKNWFQEFHAPNFFCYSCIWPSCDFELRFGKLFKPLINTQNTEC